MIHAPVAMLLATAAAWWGAPAQQACPTGIRYNVEPLAAMDNQGADIVAESHFGSCVITFRAGWRRMVTDRRACMITLHEEGHAIGLPHSDVGIMRPNTDAPVVGACMRYSDQ